MLRLLIVTSCLIAGLIRLTSAVDGETIMTWDEFKEAFNRTYEGQIETERKAIYERNLEMIREHNAEADKGLHSYWLEVTRFSDREDTSFEGCYIGAENTTDDVVPILQPNYGGVLPSHVDWREHGLVTPVKEQGRCGSCYAFSTAGALEGHLAKRKKILIDLSEQELVDCSSSYGNEGCIGGYLGASFSYVKDHGLNTEGCYPYVASKGTSCKRKPTCIADMITGFTRVPKGDEQALKAAVALHGPISVAIWITPKFKQYSRGVFDDPSCPKHANHAVLLVGYGTKKHFFSKDQDYWIVKNSWGERWGDNGYALMSRNKDDQCGIARIAYYPTSVFQTAVDSSPASRVLTALHVLVAAVVAGRYLMHVLFGQF